MKKAVLVLALALFAVNYLHAQNSDALTNTTIIKMVKAKLSDDIIIDEIGNTEVNFNLCADSVSFLRKENVSEPVLQAMKAAYNTQSQTVAPPENTFSKPSEPETTSIPQKEPPDKSSVNQAQNISGPEMKNEISTAIVSPPNENAPDGLKNKIQHPSPEELNPGSSSIKGLTITSTPTENGTAVLIEKPASVISVLSYVYPLTDLISFFNSEFASLAGAIQEWDKKTRASLEKEKQILAEIAKIEKELTDKKNADARPFSKEITDLKKNQVTSWEKHKTIKNEMITLEKTLIEEVKKKSKDTDNSVDTKFKEVSKNVKNSRPDPTISDPGKAVNIPKQIFHTNVTSHFVPVTQMLVCYQNEIIAVQDIIAAWNEKVLNNIQRDSELKSLLEPLRDELSQYMATSKQNQKLKKKEISDLKKQCDALEKERKQLAQQMADDSEKLSSTLIKMKAEVQGVLKERFADIIEHIEHAYQEKYNL